MRRRLAAPAPCWRWRSLAAGCAIPTQGAPSTIPPSQGALQPAEPAPAHHDDDAAEAVVLCPGQGLLPRLEQPAARRSHAYVAAPAPLDAIIRSMLAGPTTAETAERGLHRHPERRGGAVGHATERRRHGQHEHRLRQITGTNTELAVAQIVATVAAENGLGTGVIFEIEGQRTSVPIANGSQVAGPVYLLEFLSVDALSALRPVGSAGMSRRRAARAPGAPPTRGARGRSSPVSPARRRGR